MAYRLGIVGSEGRKFTSETEKLARGEIESRLRSSGATGVVSGGCHLGGIDLWAAEIGKSLGLEVIEYLPEKRIWNGGYKERNIQIAERSDAVICITVRRLPPEFKEGGWERYCYHCKTDQHVKSGGCWTARYAGKLNKPFEIVVIS